AQDILPDGRPWLAMERMVGTSLADEMAGWTVPLPLERGLRLADVVLDAVAAVHGRGIAHGDLTPENVFLRRPDRPKRAPDNPKAGPDDRHADDRAAALLDFGLAGGRGGDAAAVRPGLSLGTPGYMAPEVLSGEPGGAHADVYALGVILYELFTL